jgi:hypothetical protein
VAGSKNDFKIRTVKVNPAKLASSQIEIDMDDVERPPKTFVTFSSKSDHGAAVEQHELVATKRSAIDKISSVNRKESARLTIVTLKTYNLNSSN